MKLFEEYLETIEEAHQRTKMATLFTWMNTRFPNLMTEIKWNQPMYTDHGTYIIGFSVSKNHVAIAPEEVAIDKFQEDIQKAGYDHTKEIFRVKWNQDMDYLLLEKIIQFNIQDKKEVTTFWR